MPSYPRNQISLGMLSYPPLLKRLVFEREQGVENNYLLRLVSIGERNDHPNDIEVNEGRAGSEGTGQDCRLAPGYLDTPRALRHFQGSSNTCRGKNRKVRCLPFPDRPNLFRKTFVCFTLSVMQTH